MAIGAVLLAAVGGYLGWRHSVQVEAVAAYAVKDDVTVIKRLAKSADSLSAIYRVDTVRFTKTLSKWDTLKAGTDTLWQHDSIAVEVVKTIVVQADSTIKACQVVVSDCEAMVGVQKARNGVLTEEVSRLKQLQPSPIASWLTRIGFAVGGYVVGRLASGKGLP